MSLRFPFGLDLAGRTARSASVGEHIGELVEQLLLTRPGERVNRPELGCGLEDLLFGPASPEIAAAVTVSVAAAVSGYLNDLIRIEDLRVSAVDAVVEIDLTYRVLADGHTVSTQVRVPVSA